MPTVNLTKRAVDAAAALPGDDGMPMRTLYYDRDVPGFGLVVQPSGAKSYFLQYRPAGGGRNVAAKRIVLGRHGALTAEQAKVEARRLLAQIVRGTDPAAERAAVRAKPQPTATFAAVAAEWLRRDQADNRALAEVERVLRHDVLPAWGDRPMADIRKRDILALVDGICDRGAPIMANRTLAYLRRLFRWAASRDLIEVDPAVYVEKPAVEVRRDRVLGDGELAAVWQAAGVLGYPFGLGVRLLIATGCRRAEVFGLEWAEIDREARAVRLPATRVKAGEARTVPLSPLAWSVIEAVQGKPNRASDRYILALGGKAYSNVGHGKARLDAILATEGHELAPWRLHDLRRSVATGMQRLGVRLEAIEAVLGHVSGSRAGIVGVYQRHRYVEEAREALAAWGAHVQRLIDGSTTGAEVVPLRRA